MLKHYISVLIVLFITRTSSIAQPPPPPEVREAVITEIMFHPPGLDNGHLEFVELRNPSETMTRDLSSYEFTEGITYTFPTGFNLIPQEYVIICSDSLAFESIYGISARQWTNSELSDNGELLLLVGSLGQTIDSVHYLPIAPWPPGADGAGASISLCNDTLDNNGPMNWSTTSTSTGIVVDNINVLAHPGDDCFGTNSIKEQQLGGIEVYPNPSNGRFTLECSSRIKPGEYKITISDVHGKAIFSEMRELEPSSKVSFQQSIPCGVYLIGLAGDNSSFEERLIILE